MATRLVVVTGAAGGIGREVCQRFASRGERLIVSDVDSAKLSHLVNDLSSKGTMIQSVLGDVSTEDTVRELFRAGDSVGPVDVLINCVGIIERKSVLDITSTEYDRIMAVCARSYFLCMQAAVKRMISHRRPGRIVNISSISSQHISYGISHYCAAKGAVDSMTRAFAYEVAEYGITVNAIAPGVIQTGMRTDLENNVEAREQRLSTIPMGRFGTPEEVARAVEWLADPESTYVTGVILAIDGGVVVRLPWR